MSSPARGGPTLRRVLNATGVIVHTNLGRAPLAGPRSSASATWRAGYSNLEYDLADGARGSRQDHVAGAPPPPDRRRGRARREQQRGALLLALAALADGREVLVSRGELIEIGDGFRIPDVLARSGARLVEVGTTNRTRAADYERAVGAETALLLRVHQSNFRIVGFTEQPALQELAALARRLDVPLSTISARARCSTSAPSRPPEESLAAGADLVCFSGDKLLGGPQAGLIVGRADLDRDGCGAIRCTARSASTSSRSPRSRGRCSSTSSPRARCARFRCCACCARTLAAVRARAERLAAAAGGEVEETRRARRRRSAAARQSCRRSPARSRRRSPSRCAGTSRRWWGSSATGACCSIAARSPTTRSTRSRPPCAHAADGRHRRPHRPRQDVARPRAHRQGHRPAARGAGARDLDRPRLRAARAAGRPPPLARRRSRATSASSAR